MSLPTLSVILNNAPMILQGASKLVNVIRERKKQNKGVTPSETPNTLESLKKEINKVHNRLDKNDESNIQQIKLIEELARQNEILAQSLQKSSKQLNIVTILSILALIVAIILFITV